MQSGRLAAVVPAVRQLPRVQVQHRHAVAAMVRQGAQVPSEVNQHLHRRNIKLCICKEKQVRNSSETEFVICLG